MPDAAAAIRVLYVDDDIALVRLVQKALGRRGFLIGHAANPDEALAHIGSGAFDVVALDHFLAKGTGLELLAQLAKLEHAPPVVYVTGSSDMNVAVAALKAGAADFVPKTVGDDFLILLGSALAQAVDRARLQAEKTAAEEEVRRARDRAEVLLAEVNHRVGNSLSLVSAFVHLQANAMTDQVAKAALAETETRIYAIALVHKHLYSSSDVRVVGLEGYLTGLLDHLEAAMREKGNRVALKYQLEPLTLRTDASVNLGIVLTEWVTNAFKYAYVDRAGEVRVSLRTLPDGRGRLTVEDDGVGRHDGGQAKGTGIGTRIVNAMASTMNAEIEYSDRKPGTGARLSFPLLLD